MGAASFQRSVIRKRREMLLHNRARRSAVEAWNGLSSVIAEAGSASYKGIQSLSETVTNAGSSVFSGSQPTPKPPKNSSRLDFLDAYRDVKGYAGAIDRLEGVNVATEINYDVEEEEE